MEGLFGLIKHGASVTTAGGSPEAFLFSTAFADQGIDAASLAAWEEGLDLTQTGCADVAGKMSLLGSGQPDRLASPQAALLDPGG